MTIQERPLLGDVQIIRLGESGRVTFIDNATSVTIRRGGKRSGAGLQTDVGLLTFALKNDEDPLAGGTLNIGQTIQAIVGEYTPGGGSFEPIFTGEVADIVSAYPLNKSNGVKRTSVIVTVSDAVAIHTTTPRYGAFIGDPFYETFEERIGRLAESSRTPVEIPVVGAPKARYAL